MSLLTLRGMLQKSLHCGIPFFLVLMNVRLYEIVSERDRGQGFLEAIVVRRALSPTRT